MRSASAVAGLVLCQVFAGCAVADLFGAGGDGPPVTFRGTQESPSMEPTLMRGDRVVATEVPASGPSVGDVIVYENPGRWLAGREGEGHLLHRVMGTPGDTVTCCDSSGRISVNGAPMDEPYLAPDLHSCNAAVFVSPTWRDSGLRSECDWTIGPIPEGSLFVLGDNRDRAGDSRVHLCPASEASCTESPWVPIDLVRGVVDLP